MSLCPMSHAQCPMRVPMLLGPKRGLSRPRHWVSPVFSSERSKFATFTTLPPGSVLLSSPSPYRLAGCCYDGLGTAGAVAVAVASTAHHLIYFIASRPSSSFGLFFCLFFFVFFVILPPPSLFGPTYLN
ncbi:hypothetical protein B0T19DRAFT_37889 [Cercophora scortea]|uniref:Uncharacterized protein n=1 Tax=Cercophora scortea TaxID=314031 RepID=A0AAE0J4I8_9PEZI|nr:hypothetical protein B0T19DRAFT_37889 [Cercophora scortea]